MSVTACSPSGASPTPGMTPPPASLRSGPTSGLSFKPFLPAGSPHCLPRPFVGGGLPSRGPKPRSATTSQIAPPRPGPEGRWEASFSRLLSAPLEARWRQVERERAGRDPLCVDNSIPLGKQTPSRGPAGAHKVLLRGELLKRPDRVTRAGATSSRHSGHPGPGCEMPPRSA